MVCFVQRCASWVGTELPIGSRHNALASHICSSMKKIYTYTYSNIYMCVYISIYMCIYISIHIYVFKYIFILFYFLHLKLKIFAPNNFFSKEKEISFGTTNARTCSDRDSGLLPFFFARNSCFPSHPISLNTLFPRGLFLPLSQQLRAAFPELGFFRFAVSFVTAFETL